MIMKTIGAIEKQQQWDQRFMRVARHVASWSKDPSTQCGAVLVRPNRTICSVGFNGLPKGMPDLKEYYFDRSEKYPRIIHSEWNSIRHARATRLDGFSVYAWPMPPCGLCTSSLLQKGIGRVVCEKPTDEKLTRWKASFELAEQTLKQKSVPFEYASLGESVCFPDLRKENQEGDVTKWHLRFLCLSHEVFTWTKEKKRPRGVVLIRPDKTIASTGMTGLPQGVEDDHLLSNENVDAILLSAERNAILFSEDENLKGCTAYVWPTLPNLNEASHLINEGIETIVCPKFEGQEDPDPRVLSLFKEGSIIFVNWNGEYLPGFPNGFWSWDEE